MVKLMVINLDLPSLVNIGRDNRQQESSHWLMGQWLMVQMALCKNGGVLIGGFPIANGYYLMVK